MTAQSAELWASQQPKVEKEVKGSVQRWSVEPPHQAGHSTVSEITQMMAALGWSGRLGTSSRVFSKRGKRQGGWTTEIRRMARSRGLDCTQTQTS